MKERQVLLLLEELAENWYQKTGDKWWKKISKMVSEKREVNKWWLK